MKLVKCYVSSFGKLKDFTYDFNAGLNTIKQDNGWGKTTLATFIKAMFYGLNDSKRSVSENERVKFKPWGESGKFGGYVQFVWGDKEFKLERYFGAKESEDTIALYDVASGKQFSDTENLGRRIFEIDEEGFLSTTYFAQKDFQVKSNTSLTAKFNAVCEVQDSDAFDKAVVKLEDKAKTYKYRGDKGLISDTKREIYYLNDEMDRANRALNTVKILKEEEKELKDTVAKLQETTSLLTNKVVESGKAEAIAVKKNRYDKLNSEKINVEQNIKSAEEIFNGNNVTENDVEMQRDKLHSLRSLKDREKLIESDIVQINESRKNAPKNPHFDTLTKSLFAINMLLIIVSIAMFIAQISEVVWVFGAGFILSIILLVKIFVFEKNNKKNQSSFDELLTAKNLELERITNEKNQIETELSAFINQFNFGEKLDQSTSLDYLAKIVRVYLGMQEKRAEIDKEIKELGWDNSYNNAEIKVEGVTALNQELKSVQAEYARKTNELSSKRSAIAMHEQVANSYTELESKKAELVEKVARYEQEYDILTKTIKYLKQADENLKIKYREPLQNSLKKYFAYVNGSEKEVNIDVDLKVSIEEKSGQKSTEYYSKGYQNLFEICKRFALTDVLFTGEKPFIILDDPFYNLDDKKVAFAKNLLVKLASDYQILYLICHDSRSV